MRWSEEQTVIFVKIYLQHEYLWNTKHEHYGQKYLRKKAYKNISSLFEEATGIKLIEREVMTKIRNLGSTYAQELTKIKKRSESDQPYRPGMKWFHYWYRCKHDNQPVSDDPQTTSDSQKMWLVLLDNDNEHDSSVTDRDKKETNSNNRRWGEEETVKFVKIYLQHKILWNPEHTYFRNNKLRKKAYAKICSQFNSASGISLTVTEAIIKIRSLKSTYAQEVAKIKRLSNPDFTHESTLKWFADWDSAYNAKFSNDATEGRVPESDEKLWLELSTNEDEEDMEPKQCKSEETITKTKWNEADTLKFVKIYLQYEFLYNPKHKYFRQKKLRHEGYSCVISEFEAATGIKLDEKELKSKIKILGSTYAQELTKIKKRSGTDQPYSPTIKWFQYWHKHKYAMQKRNARNAASEEQEPGSMSEEEQKMEPESEESSHSQDSDSECEVRKKSRKVKSESQDCSDKYSINFVDTNSESLREDEFEHYGKYIASVLRSMELDKALQIQLEIQNLLSAAQ